MNRDEVNNLIEKVMQRRGGGLIVNPGDCWVNEIVRRGPYTVAMVDYLGLNQVLVGVAKCSSEDGWNEKVGESIAVCRAIEHLIEVLNEADRKHRQDAWDAWRAETTFTLDDPKFVVLNPPW